ncbi:ABC transporter ATP-binding protein [Paracoccus sp. IB05]|uniref:ABC transporter ATP-binding protein n=1 Tax=Paracoccus sp. IB05 TaxID=2779367 RepID=UPI0018E6EA15|nr:ABC transporter ATP-binding protein [Paracoccus sp. IB05]MBJ2151800.1 ABC transporter ATP-binding protein [Paracoccus sp. IB05]
MLHLEDLSLSEGGVPHLAGISLKFKPGLTTLLGRTGAGKTTLLRAIAGLVQPAGRISFNGEDWSHIPPWRRPVAMVTQQFINYPHLNVLDNLAFPLIRRGEEKAAAREAARDMLGRVGLAQMASRRPSELSGGQQQRVAIARALVKGAPILLLDEPFVNLDYNLREGMREELSALLHATRTTVIYASTDPREALRMGDAVVLMSEGRALQSGPPRAVFTAPETLEAAKVVNDPPVNLLGADLSDTGLEIDHLGAAPRDSITGLPPGRYTLALRAEDIRQGGDLMARVALTEVTGSETVTHLDAGGQPLVMLERRIADHALGQNLCITPDLSRALVYGADGRLIAKGGQNG